MSQSKQRKANHHKLQPIDKTQKYKQDKKRSDQKLSLNKFKILKYLRGDTLSTDSIKSKKVVVETDTEFIESLHKITKSKESMLAEIIGVRGNNLTDLQCQEIHFKGRLHGQANIINKNSHKSKKDVEQDESFDKLFCSCGCNRMKGSYFSVFDDIQMINILGSGVLLFFFFLKSLCFNLLFFILIYSIFALATNLLGTFYDSHLFESNCTSSYCEFRDKASRFNIDNSYFTQIQGWLGLAAMVIWGIVTRFVKFYAHQKDKMIDQNLTSSADFAIKINNLPYGEYNEQEIMEYFQKLWKQIQHKNRETFFNNEITKTLKIHMEEQMDKQKIRQLNQTCKKGQNIELTVNKFILGMVNLEKHEGIKQTNHLGIKSIQIIYNMEFSRKMIQNITDLCLSIDKQIVQKQGLFIVKDKLKYMELKKDLIQCYELFQDLRKKFLNDQNFRKNISTTSTLIEFDTQDHQKLVLYEYGHEKLGIFKQIKQKIKNCCENTQNSIIFKGVIPEIQRAPQPSDILWENCQKRQSLVRMLVIYFATFGIILISFGIIIGFNYAQVRIQNNPNALGESSSTVTIINVIISLVLQVVNKILWLALFYLLDLEYNHTRTNKIISQMHKTQYLILINIIVLPILVNYVFQNQLFGAQGLAGIVFDYHVSALVVNLVLKLIDPISSIIKLCLSVRCIREYFIKARYNKKESSNDDDETLMKKIYSLYESPSFDIAESYVFIITNVLHAAFFCTLQPFVLILVLLECFGFYWICKILILKLRKIPQLLELSIFQVAIYQIMQVPIFYGVGSIVTSYGAHKYYQNRPFEFISGSICIIIGVINYTNPKNIVQIITDKLADCFNCLNSDIVLKKQQKPSEQEIAAQIDGKDSLGHNQKNTRIEDYYKQSNSLSLLGFQKLLIGSVHVNQIAEQLQNYCKSHIVQNMQVLNKEEAVKRQQKTQKASISQISQFQS